ncbi:MAG: clostripain-related cysteine peptidase [Candidatus Heimdallarchaeota archaeon]
MIRRYGGVRWNSRTRIALVVIMVFIIPATLAISPAWAKPIPQWTFMVYMAADNNLDYFGYENMEAMREGLIARESPQDVNVVVLWDKYDDVTNLYKVTTDEPELVNGFLLNGEEANMGDPDTLQAFVKYAMRHFRASHYVLVLWDHGDDFRGCCWDDHPYDYLSHQEITQALSRVKQLDILAFDACVEGMIEVVYEYAWTGLQIDYVIATEGYVPLAGYPYAKILEHLDPAMTAKSFAKVIVDDYIAFYETLRPASRHAQLASIDMQYVATIVQQLGDLTDVLKGHLLDPKQRDFYHDMIANARGEGNLQWSEYGWEAYIDLPSFVNHLTQSLKIAEAELLYTTLMTAIYNNASEPMTSAGAEGLGIFFPNSYDSFQNNVYWHGDKYLAMQFPHEGWWDFLQAYWGK